MEGTKMSRESMSFETLKAATEMLKTQARGDEPVPTPSATNPQSSKNAYRRLLVDAYLTGCGVGFRKKDEPIADGREVYVLHECPFNPEHGKRGESCVMQDASGKLSFKCQHAQCSGYSWKDVREALGNPDKDHFEGPEPDESDSRAIVEVTNDEHAVNEQVIALLADGPELFQRAGELVHVVTDAEVQDSIDRSPSGTRIRQLPQSALRGLISQHVDFRRRVRTKDGDDLKKINVPDWCVRAIHRQGSWQGIRPITGLITTPTIRPDGTFINTPGYDEKTGLYFRPYGEIPVLPENPSQQDAREAATRLRAVFADFPFAQLEHFAALLAYLLTLLGRHAFAGPSPLFLFDANVRGSGKTLLVDLASSISSGHEMPRMTNPGDDDEFRKRITALVMAGDSTVLIDNVDGKLGCASLDCALTSTRWKDRPLGRSEIVELPLRITWAATGNNIMLVGDASRRVAYIRLESPEERPEERKGFRHADIKCYVREHRTELLGDALTILSAFINAGRPDQKLSSWGSFEGWSKTVRQAVVWCGLPDPGLTRKELVEASDTEANALRQLLLSWREIDPKGKGLTCGDLLKKLEVAPDKYTGVRSAVLEVAPPRKPGLPGAQYLGTRFGKYRRRVIDGLRLDYREGRARSRIWCVVAVEPNQSTTEPQFGDTGDTDDSI
jgi:hypothetical protein